MPSELEKRALLERIALASEGILDVLRAREAKGSKAKGEAKADAWAQVNAGLDALVRSGWATPTNPRSATAEAIAAAVEKAVGEERAEVLKLVDACETETGWVSVAKLAAAIRARGGK